MATNSAINSNDPIQVARGGTGLATITSHGIMVGAGTGAIVPLAEASDGQIPIGSTGNPPTLATITAGSLISVTNASGAITVAAATPTSFLAYLTTTQSNTTGDGTAFNIIYDSTLANNDTGYSTSTGLFTAPTAGLYQFGGTWFISGWLVGHTVMQGILIGSGSFSYYTVWNNPVAITEAGSNILAFTWSNFVNMAQNDTVQPRITVSGSTKVIDFQGSTANPNQICNDFWGYKVT